MKHFFSSSNNVFFYFITLIKCIYNSMSDIKWREELLFRGIERKRFHWPLKFSTFSVKASRDEKHKFIRIISRYREHSIIATVVTNRCTTGDNHFYTYLHTFNIFIHYPRKLFYPSFFFIPACGINILTKKFYFLLFFMEIWNRIF